jgi:para-nitrobenzyl esterase
VCAAVGEFVETKCYYTEIEEAALRAATWRMSMGNRSADSKVRLYAARTRSSLQCAGAALALTLATGTMASAEISDAANRYLVQTKEGPVQGFAKNGITEFLGIPYAAPPVGKLRWMPPQEHAPWTKVFQATTYGPTCAQSTTLGVFAGPLNNNEDCLFLKRFHPKGRTG